MKPDPARVAPLVLTLLGATAAGPVLATGQGYVEFLWAPALEGAPARAEAFGLVMDRASEHRICVEAVDSVGSGAAESALRIEVVDAAGEVVDRQRHEGFTGGKTCYPAGLAPEGQPGDWTFNVYLHGELLATRTIEVARTLDEASFHADPARPYVLGRPNYDPRIPPGEYVGRLSWIMSVDAAGVVRKVELETSEGAGKRMEDRALAAGYLTRFPPNPSLTAPSFKVRQEYLLEAD